MNNYKLLHAIVLSFSVLAAGCAGTHTVRTSADTAIVQASAEAACGSTGAARVAQRQAAIETIKAGYDRYVIFDAAAANNVQLAQLPGTYNSSSTVTGNFITTTTTYQPGAMISTGNYDQSFSIKMFKDGDPNGSSALSAREILGPKWPELIKSGSVTTCL